MAADHQGVVGDGRDVPRGPAEDAHEVLVRGAELEPRDACLADRGRQTVDLALLDEACRLRRRLGRDEIRRAELVVRAPSAPVVNLAVAAHGCTPLESDVLAMLG